MKKKLLLFLILNLTNFVYCQENLFDDKYKNETKLVISYIFRNFLQESNINIDKTATIVEVNNCTSTYDSPMLYSNEKEYVRECIKNPKIKYWTEDFFPNCKIIESKKIDEIFKDNANGWNEFQKQYGGSIAQFSSPIFLRNYEIVIIKFSITSDYLAGLGYEAIFIRNGDNWEISACSWDN